MRNRIVTAGIAALAVVALAGCNPQGGNSGAESTEGGEAVAAPDSVQLIAPADPGGGWDQTARALSEDLTAEGLVDSAPVSNIGRCRRDGGTRFLRERT